MSQNEISKKQKASRIGSPISAFNQSLKLINSVGAKKVLDCPAGQGAFAEMLTNSSIDVSCCDIRPDHFIIDEIECKECDMNESLPYDDHLFDAVTCLNGLHRIWARGRAISEMARVMKPGGHMIITIPNPNNIMRRLSYFLTGVSIPNTIGPPHCFSPDVSPPSAHVRLPITLPEIDTTSQSVGLKIEKVLSIQTCKASVLLFPLVLPIWLLAPLARIRGRLNKCSKVNRSHTLFSERILIVLKKK